MAALTQHHVPPPALVLLAVRLPKLDDYRVARAFKQHPRGTQTPIRLRAGQTGRLDKLGGQLVGADGYLSNPVPPAEV